VRLITLPEYDVISLAKDKDLWNLPVDKIYGILAAPPCTQFSKADWRRSRDKRDFVKGMEIVRACMNIIWRVQEEGAPLKFWALENPLGYLYNFLGKPAFYFQPWQFGEKPPLATKRIAIWGYFNQPAKTVLKRNVPFIHNPKNKDRRQNHGWYKLSVEERAITPAGFAQAFFKANK